MSRVDDQRPDGVVEIDAAGEAARDAPAAGGPARAQGILGHAGPVAVAAASAPDVPAGGVEADGVPLLLRQMGRSGGSRLRPAMHPWHPWHPWHPSYRHPRASMGWDEPAAPTCMNRHQAQSTMGQVDATVYVHSESNPSFIPNASVKMAHPSATT